MRHYTLRSFLRTAPNELLAEYFKRDDLLSDIDFSKLKPRKPDVVFDAIQELKDDVRAKVDTDFQDIFALAYAGGIKFMLDVATDNNLDLAPLFDTVKGHYAKVFLVFLNHKQIFEDALEFSCRDNLTGHWRKRLGFPALNNPDFSTKKEQFASAIGAHFRGEGRGRACTVDYKNRGHLHYFFAYPEDYSHSYLHYVGGTLRPNSYTPAFQVIFLYNAAQGSLDIYHEGSKEAVQSLQEIFAKSTLGIDRLNPPPKEHYELDALKYPNFQFKLQPEWGIKSISINELGVSRFLDGELRQCVIKCKNSQSRGVYEELDLFFPYHSNDGRPSRASALPFCASITAEFTPQSGRKRKNQRTFNITHNGCHLKYEGRDLILRQMLADSGLEGSGDKVELNVKQPVFEPA